jgi:hypothetical protein
MPHSSSKSSTSVVVVVLICSFLRHVKPLEFHKSKTKDNYAEQVDLR